MTAPSESSDIALFAFENDFVESLRCIPMAVRRKLDRSGVKLTLRQWSRLTRDDRHSLLTLSCADPAETSAYRMRLMELAQTRSGETPKFLSGTPEALRLAAGGLPSSVVGYARLIGAKSPTRADWQALTELQRFALIKLSRDNHDNVNFLPALREFGLA